MTTIIKSGTAPTERAKSEVPMRISVKSWSEKVWSRGFLGFIVGYVGYVGYVGLGYIGYIRMSVTKILW